MAAFDEFVTKLAHYVEEMREKGRRVGVVNCHPAKANNLLEGLSIQIGKQTSQGIILRADTFVELGNPDVGSCTFLLWTDNPSMVSDGKITLIGPNIQESAGASLPYGQVLIMGGANLGEKDQRSLERCQYISDQIEGYMLKIVSQRIWGRVSKDAAAKGFCFEVLGRNLMAKFKSDVPEVESAEIIFVTSCQEDLQELDIIAKQVRIIASNINKEIWKAKGFDLECDLDCGSCRDRSVCDEIREVLAVRKSGGIQN